ncbi:MAG: hypothetical protein JWM39_96 [Parcubacteria group bacterium]|nr:hypothetical protein [Parcubacteria group bacterium]
MTVVEQDQESSLGGKNHKGLFAALGFSVAIWIFIAIGVVGLVLKFRGN